MRISEKNKNRKAIRNVIRICYPNRKKKKKKSNARLVHASEKLIYLEQNNQFFFS